MEYVYKNKKISNNFFELEEKSPLVIKSKIKDVEDLEIFDETFKEVFISEMFLRKFRNIIKSISELDENDDEGTVCILGEIQRLENLLLAKYQDHVAETKIKKMLKELYLLEKKIKVEKETVYNRKNQEKYFDFMNNVNSKDKCR